MKRAAVFLLAAGIAMAQTVSLTVNTATVLHEIDARIYGLSVDGGVWGEVVRNRSFEETVPEGAAKPIGAPTPAWHWTAVGDGEISLDRNLPFNGSQSLRMVARGGDAGTEQAGFAVRAGDALRGSLWLSGSGPGVVVRLVDGGRVLAEQTVGAPDAEWQEFPLLLNPTADSGNATLRILAGPKSDVKLDQVTLMPDSYRANGGFRPDLTQAVSALRPPVLRRTGGGFGTLYKWKDGIGPQAKRVGEYAGEEWDPQAFGIDEFLAFARKVGAEPVIVIGVGPRNPVDRAASLRDAVDLLEYCNGPRDSAWGKVRARNGHPEPYGVKYWEMIVGRTGGDMLPADYVAALGQYVSAMKKVAPAIRIVAGGSGQRGARWMEGVLAVIRDAARLADYMSAPVDGQAAGIWGSLEAEIARSANPRLKLFVTEGNARSAGWRGGIEAGGMLNAMERDAGVAMAAAFQIDWLAELDRSSRFPMPEYVVMKLYRDHFAPDLLQMGGELGGLNAIATRSADGEKLYVKLVNPGEGEVPVEIALRGDFPLIGASIQLVAPGSLTARAPVRVVEGTVEVRGMTVRVRLPRWSVAVVTMSR